ncbi:hypothetical protein PGC35_06285 [Psychrobacillus sp. PGGUH221]|uniref:hypothetical protein n=1 Tax=Psychrobacillus sp. PGGUH221 TaxID=3020058 RepID=UPI0035C76A74
MFRYVKEVKLIKDNPTDSAFIPKNKLEIEDIDGSNVSKLYLEPDELEEFLEYVNKYRNIIISPILHLIAFTGMRPGEAISLLESDIDFENCLISITKTT